MARHRSRRPSSELEGLGNGPVSCRLGRNGFSNAARNDLPVPGLEQNQGLDRRGFEGPQGGPRSTVFFEPRCYGPHMARVEARGLTVGPSHVLSGAALLAVELSEIARGIRGLDLLRRSVDRAPPV
jgi:hypothetical protein